MASYRHLARKCVMQALFAAEFNKIDVTETLEELLDEFAPKLTERDFAFDTLNGVIENRDVILALISKFAPHWPIEKIAKIDKAILEIAIYELEYSNAIPGAVAINEAVEIAKEFGDDNSSKFINGVLSSVMEYSEKDESKEDRISNTEEDEEKN